MNYKFFLVLICLINSCTPSVKKVNTNDFLNESTFKNNGFAIIYNDKLYKEKTISSKLDNRDLLIFQRNLKKGSIVKIKNNINNKSIIAKVGKNAKYPLFNNSVITQRIANTIEINIKEPYIEITEIKNQASFIAKKAKTYDEEKKVADKAPVTSISINDLNSTAKEDKKKIKNEFSYIIKIADFYFKNSADLLIERIVQETTIKNATLKSLSQTNHRVFLGPFNNLISLKKAFNDISLLEFENIEIIKDD